jgi:hypothetical protein
MSDTKMKSVPGYGAVPPANPGSGTVIISTPDATATYTASSVTVAPKTHANVTLTSSGVTYTTGTGVGYNPVEATWSGSTRTNAGTMHAIDIMMDGVSLKQLLEERLNLLVPNPELEAEWKELKQLGDAYRKLEADLKEKARIWQALNKKS